MAACRAFDVGPNMRAPTFADEKESDTVVLFVLDEGSDNFVRDLYNNRWRLALKFTPSKPKPVYTPGAPGFAEDTNRPRQPPIVEDHKKYSHKVALRFFRNRVHPWILMSSYIYIYISPIVCFEMLQACTTHVHK